MKKLIIKTIVIALSIIIAIIFMAVALISAVYPLTIANASFKLGNKDLAVKYTEKHYLKNGDYDDLALLVERAIFAENDNVVIKYAPKFISAEDFYSYSQSKSGDYVNYIANGYVVSLYNEGEIDKAINVAFQYVDAAFTIPNPVTTLVYTASGKNDVPTLQKILTVLESLEENENIIKVINAVKSFI